MPTGPYDQLYIYEIIGDARPAAQGLGQAFLGLWLEGDTSFLFFGRPSDELVAGLLAGRPGLALRERHHLSYAQWQGGMELEPLMMPCLAVVPAWQAHEPRPGQRLLRLDPGLVFGNGLHPTTRHCLELLTLRAEQAPLGRVLDLGCGSGILGLAAALMGAEAVTCVDLNPLCVETTRRNAALNALDLEVREGPAGDYLARPAGLVLANLHWEVQRELWRAGPALIGKRDLILSGLLRSQRGPLVDLLAAAGYQVLHEREADQTWFSLWAGADRPAWPR
ncbi:MAG: 50S ribosomal protein L11 methyltransferase [Thermodesulfobacteriota bacterium]